MAGMRSKTLKDNIISWPESGGEKMETLDGIDKGKDREVMKEYDNKWSRMDIEDGGDKDNEIEGVEEAVRTLVSSAQSNGVENI